MEIQFLKNLTKEMYSSYTKNKNESYGLSIIEIFFNEMLIEADNKKEINFLITETKKINIEDIATIKEIIKLIWYVSYGNIAITYQMVFDCQILLTIYRT